MTKTQRAKLEALVEAMRKRSDANTDDAENQTSPGVKGRSFGRADAYANAARWLEDILKGRD